jgi:hypothetical protein
LTWGPGDVSLVMLVVLILVVMINDRSRKSSGSLSASIIMIILISAINLTSYKLIFITVCMIASLHILASIQRKADRSKNEINLRSFAKIVMFSSVIVLAFNFFFYNEFVPTFTLAANSSPALGLTRLLSILNNNEPNPLAQYSSSMPGYMLYESLVRLVLVFCAVIALFLSFFISLKRKNKVDTPTLIATSISIGGIIVFGVYVPLGLAEFAFITFCGLVALTVFKTRRLMKVSTVLICCIVLLNAAMAIQAVETGYFVGQKSGGNTVLLGAVTEWYSDVKGSGNHNCSEITSDVLTRSYWMMACAKEGTINSVSNGVSVFTPDEIKMLLGLDPDQVNRSMLFGNVFVINYDEQHFSIMNWQVFKSWSVIGNRLPTITNLDIIYSSGGVEIATYVGY